MVKINIYYKLLELSIVFGAQYGFVHNNLYYNFNSIIMGISIEVMKLDTLLIYSTF